MQCYRHHSPCSWLAAEQASVSRLDNLKVATKTPATKTEVQLKLLFTISVVRNRLLFMTEIPCRNHSVQKSLCGERLPADCDQRPPDFAHTEPFTCKCT